MAAGARWTEAELRACVEAYAQMYRDFVAGRDVQRAKVAEILLTGELRARTAGSIFMRFSNISALLEMQGKPYLSNFRPLRNVGPPSKALISSLLAANGLL